MAFSPDDLLPGDGDDASGSTRTRALVTGSVALGALITGAVLEKARHRKYPLPLRLPRAVEATVRELEIMEGVTRFYHHPGEGTPVVLLHSINAAGSTFEMKPLFEHFVAAGRPVYALDWLGFGKSDRPPVMYSPGLYQRQLRRTLSEIVGEPADVIALSLACEYAATVANAFPFLFHRLALISPTAVGGNEGPARFQRAMVSAAGTAGLFELMFSRLSSREALRAFYARNVFAQGATVPDDLVEYSYLTTHTRGAHFAPRRFIQGELFMHMYATRGYQNLTAPTLFVIPARSASSVQQFSGAEEIASSNEAITLHRTDTGLLPQWEKPAETAESIETFFAARTVVKGERATT